MLGLFIFRDPHIFYKQKSYYRICNKIIEKKINCRFVIETHLRILDRTFNSFKECGLVGVKVGVENFDTELLKKEGRFTVSRDDQLEKIKEIKLKNIAISAMYIISFPSDTKDSMEKTLNVQ